MTKRLARYLSTGTLLSAVLAVQTFSVAPVMAKSWVQTQENIDEISADVVIDGTITMRSDEAFSEVRVANTDIADVVILSDKSFYLTGKDRGRTSVMVYDGKKRLLDVIAVNVNYDVQGLKKAFHQSFPKENIEVRRMAGKIYISGRVSTNKISEQALKIAEAYAGENVTNGLSIRDSHQVMLEVRFVEATRTVIKELGVGLLTQQAGEFTFASGVGLLGSPATPAGSLLLSDMIGPTSIDARIDALEERGVIRTLAEPNLISMSGQKASFLAGGEFPIPVSARNGEIAIVYRQFGVGLSFTPTVLDDGVINLQVSPEVSQLDETTSIRVGGVAVPSLSIRRADTTVELRNSQSFAIAGLLQNTQTNNTSQVPWLGDVPVLGALFRSSRYKNNETELVIIVTPRLVQPVSDISKLSTPLDGKMNASEAELFLHGRVDGLSTETHIPTRKKAGKTTAKGGLSASYGHVLQ
jgi:pilus assembly protein CpaC